jgi:hypothetical protein
MDPSLTHEDGADGKLGAGVKIGLTDCVDDAGKGVCCGGELGDGESLDCCFGSEEFDWTVGIYVFCRESVRVKVLRVARALVQRMCANMLT